MAKETEAKKKTKLPTAQKRMLQNEKRRVINKTRKSQIRTAIRRLQDAVASGEKTAIQTHLSSAYSLIDKAVKTGIYQKNKGSRTKARLTAFASTAK